MAATNYTDGSGQYPDGTPAGLDVTRREEFQDKITIMSPNDTPMFSLLSTRAVRNIHFSWMVDHVEQPTGVVGHTETAIPAAVAGARLRLENNVMIVRKKIDVSGSQRAQNEAGVEDEYSYQLVKKGLEAAKQMEWNMLWSDYQARVGDATEARTAGLCSWLAETGLAATSAAPTDSGVVGPNTIDPDFASTWYDGGGTDMSEDTFNDSILGPSWANGCDINSTICFVGTAMKRHISKYGMVFDTAGGTELPIMRSNVRSDEALRAITVDSFMTEFGLVHIVLNRYMRDPASGANYTTQDYSGGTGGPGVGPAAQAIYGSKTLIGIDPQYFSIPTLRPFQYAPLGKTVDSDQAFVVGEMGFQCDNPIAGYGGHDLLA